MKSLVPLLLRYDKYQKSKHTSNVCTSKPTLLNTLTLKHEFSEIIKKFNTFLEDGKKSIS